MQRSPRIPANSMGGHWAAEFLQWALNADSPEVLMEMVLETICRELKFEGAAVLSGAKGHWRCLAKHQLEEPWPTDLLSESLDQDGTASQNERVASVLDAHLLPGQILLAKGPPESVSPEAFDSLAAAFAQALCLARRQQSSDRRANRMTRLLDITQSWNQNRETETLLFEIAEAATQLLDAERATLFLIDAVNHELVGRPALGVESGEIRIPLGAGVVGEVVQTGHSQRVDEDIATEQDQIHRDVDEALNFETRSLVCVPMSNSEDKIIGAFEVINKSTGMFTDEDLQALEDLAVHAALAIENTRYVERLASSRRQIAEEAADKVHLIGECEPVQKLRDTINRVAGTELAILILGENGTGKEVVAQMIHYLSERRDQVLVAVNCAAITESLLESELFGHEKGAFTDAHQARQGKFELADGGTLFLDEIGDMSLGGQAKLLRVLEEKIVVRVGGSTPIATDTRVIAATNQDLAQLVRDKKFREDLFFRLNVVTIELPPLRERGEDVLLLAEHFLKQFCAAARRKPPKLTAAARKRLLGHGWPGNIRELRNLMERMAYLSEGDKIDADELAFIMSPRDPETGAVDFDQPLADATRLFQIDYIRKHIERSRGNMTDAAGRLGLHRSNLYRKMRQLGMNEGDQEEAEE